MYVPFQKWNCFGIVPFQANMQFNSHSFDSISCQFVIPLQFTLKVENSRIIPIQKFQFQCPGTSPLDQFPYYTGPELYFKMAEKQLFLKHVKSKKIHFHTDTNKHLVKAPSTNEPLIRLID